MLLPVAAVAATSVQQLTPINTSVLGGERQVYSVRVFDALNRPAAGETVSFSNDACGFFDNGAFATTAVTDASGVASAGFTARPQGITCWITVQAGVRAVFNVFTYTKGQVALSSSLSPAEPRPGQSFNFVALASAGAYPIYGSRVEARVVPPEAADISAGSDAGPGRTQFAVTPRGFGPYAIEMSYRDITRRHSIAAMDSPLQDMWWGGASENGWGMSIVQHGDRLFAAIYAYDASGNPTWYVMPGGAWNAAHTVFTGPLYSPKGAPYAAYDAAKLAVGEAVGTATITFSGVNEAMLEVSIGASSTRKALVRQPFGTPETVAAPRQVGDMWWGGASQNGWGIALLQQHRMLFGVWFTYDESGAPTWFVMPSGFWADADTWRGRLYRTQGSPWLGATYDATRL
ncbi:MAG TPA: Ig-like domain-containing protein, partial [Usitatibacter sp.]|nr:Ig-like domain-containing protein [Usitatibacter sp.]